MRGKKVLDNLKFAWLSRFQYDAEWGSVESAQQGLNLCLGDRANISTPLELGLHNFIKLSLMFVKGWPVWWGEGECNLPDSCIKAKLKVVGYARVFLL